jgi:hypothetical protein
VEEIKERRWILCLVEYAVRTESEACFCTLPGRGKGEHKNKWRSGALAQRPEDKVAIAIGHRQVEHQQVRLEIHNRVHCFAPCPGNADDFHVPHRAEAADERVPEKARVICDNNSEWAVQWHSPKLPDEPPWPIVPGTECA